MSPIKFYWLLILLAIVYATNSILFNKGDKCSIVQNKQISVECDIY